MSRDNISNNYDSFDEAAPGVSFDITMEMFQREFQAPRIRAIQHALGKIFGEITCVEPLGATKIEKMGPIRKEKIKYVFDENGRKCNQDAHFEANDRTPNRVFQVYSANGGVHYVTYTANAEAKNAPPVFVVTEAA